MVKNGPFLNADSSEEDSVKTNTTNESDTEDVYNVDKILYERKGHNNRVEYLLLWEGYPLHIASFEPKEHLTDDVLLKQWAEQKALIAQGKAEAFDLKDWEDAWVQAHVEREDRAKRRKAKRRRRGITVSPTDDKRPAALNATDATHPPGRKSSNRTRRVVDSDDSDGDDSTLPPKAAKVSTTKKPPRKRLGVATKVTGSRRIVLDSLEGESNDVPQPDSDLDSLFEGSLPDSQSASRPQQSQSTSTPSSSKTLPVATKKALPRKQQIGPTKTTGAAKATTASSTTKKAGPAATAQRSRGPFTANWDKPKKPRADQAAGHKTPSDTIEVKRYTLSTQNRLQKSGRNERTPDPSALTMIDPKTGKTAPLITPRSASKLPKQAKAKTDGEVRSTMETGGDVGATTSPTSNARASPSANGISPVTNSPPEPSGVLPATVGDSHNVYSRRTPQPERRRSLTPKSVEDHNDQPSDKHESTCAFWLRGHCKYSAEDCNFAHRDTGRYVTLPEQRKASGAKQGVTCDFWLEGRCTNTADDCEFIHYDTGVYSKRTLEKTQMQSTIGLPHSARSHVPAVLENAGSDPEHMLASETTVPTEGLSWHQKKQITCFFWHKFGFCKNSDDACAFAHRQTGLVARDPSITKKTSGKFGVPTVFGASTFPPNLAPATPGAHAAVEVPNRRPSINRDVENNDQLDATSPAAWLPSPAVVAENMTTTAQASVPAVAHETAAPALNRETAPAVPQNSAHRLASDPRLRNRAALTTYHASLHVQVSQSQVVINASLPAIDSLRMSKLVPPDAPDGTTHPPDLIFQKVIVLEELARIPELQPAQAVSSCIVPSDSDSIVNAKAVADLCQKCNIVYFVAYEMFTMLIYPQGSDKFSFMDGAEVSSGSSEQTSLRLKVGPAVASLPRHVPFVLASPPPDPCDTVQRTDLERVFTQTDSKWLVPEKDHKNGLRGLIVIMPEERATEISLLERYYKDHDCEVVQYPEDWEWFKENFKASGTIIVHRKTELCKISGLYKVADKGGSTILSFGVQMLYDEMNLAHRNAVYSYERLFTMGRATFITDDVFIYAPRTATDIINTFLDKTRPKPIGGETGKIITRPSIKAWLQDLATNTSHKNLAHREEYVMLYQAICELCPPEHETRYRRFGAKDEITSLPNDKSHLISKDAMDLEWWWMPGLWERDPTLHTDKMVEWFAGFSAGPLATKFRRMVIVHEPKEGRGVMKNGRSVYEKERDPRGWASKYQHLTVLRPKEWLATHK